MRRAISIVLIALLGTAVVVSPAGAAKKKKSLKVTMSQLTMIDCTVPPDQVRVAMAFDATVKRRNAKLPGRITVNYKLTNPQTGEVKIAETLTLKPKEYFNIGTPVGVTVGSQWQFDGSFTYKSTINGRRQTSATAFTLTIPTNEELAAQGVKACV